MADASALALRKMLFWEAAEKAIFHNDYTGINRIIDIVSKSLSEAPDFIATGLLSPKQIQSCEITIKGLRALIKQCEAAVNGKDVPPDIWEMWSNDMERMYIVYLEEKDAP